MASAHAHEHARTDAFEDAHPYACTICGRTEHEAGVRIDRDTRLCAECDDACSGPALPGVVDEMARKRRLNLI